MANLSKTLHINFYQNRSSIVEVMIQKFWCVFYASQKLKPLRTKITWLRRQWCGKVRRWLSARSRASNVVDSTLSAVSQLAYRSSQLHQQLQQQQSNTQTWSASALLTETRHNIARPRAPNVHHRQPRSYFHHLRTDSVCPPGQSQFMFYFRRNTKVMFSPSPESVCPSFR